MTKQMIEESEADTINKLERKAKSGKATQGELNLLAECYVAYKIIMPKWFLKLYGERK